MKHFNKLKQNLHKFIETNSLEDNDGREVYHPLRLDFYDTEYRVNGTFNRVFLKQVILLGKHTPYSTKLPHNLRVKDNLRLINTSKRGTSWLVDL